MAGWTACLACAACLAAVVDVPRLQAQAKGRAPSASIEATLAATVSETRMVETVRRLVGFGTRTYGTPSNHEAAAWLAASFREAGDGDAYYHSVGDTPANTTDTEPSNMGWCARVGLLSAQRLIKGLSW